MKHLFSIAVLALIAFVSAGVVHADVVDVSGKVTIQKSGFVFNRLTNTYDLTITLTNSSAFVLEFPLSLVISGLPTSVTLANASGTTESGEPFVAVASTAPSFAPTDRASAIALKFGNPKRVGFAPQLTVLASEWPNLNDAHSGISFSYPAFDLPQHTRVERTNLRSGGSLYRYDVVVATSPQYTGIQYSVIVEPNAGGLGLAEWYAKQFDPTGSLRAVGTYRQLTLDNGMEVLILAGPTPVDWEDGALPGIIAISASKKSQVTIVISNDQSLTQDLDISHSEIRAKLLTTLRHMQLP